MNGIREAVQKMMENKIGNDKSMLCTVISVSGSTCNVTTLDTEVDLFDVRLQTATANGVLLKPKVGSIVVITPITDFEFLVVMFSELDTITLLDGSFGGLVIVADLVDKLNALENKVNSIISTFNTHVHAGVTTGAGSSAVTPSLITGTLTPTQVADIENDLITHGEV